MSRFDKVKQYYLSHKLIANLALLVCMFFVCVFFKPFVWVAFSVLCLYVLFDNLENGFSYIIASFPFYLISGLQSSIMYFVSIIIYAIKFFIIVYVKEKKPLNKRALIFGLIFLVYLLLPIGGYSLRMALKVLMLMFVILIISAIKKKNDFIRFDFNVKLLAVSLIISALFGLFNYVHFIITENAYRFMALFDKTTILAMVCDILIGFLAYLIIKDNNWKNWVLFSLVSLIGLMTISKQFIIIFVLVVLVLFIVEVKRSPKKTLAITGIGVASAIVICLIFPKIALAFYNRFFETFASCKDYRDVLNMLTTGRYDIWLEYLKFLVENPIRLIFGCGLGAGRVNVMSSHNAYISMIYQLGLVGTTLFILAIVFTIKTDKIKNGNVGQVKTKNKFNKAWLISIIVLALLLLFEDMIFYIF